MKINTLRSSFVVLAGTLMLFGGCTCHSVPKAPDKPDLDSAAAGAAAIEQYDTNGDGKLDAKEIAKSPPLRFALKRIDTDGDGAITADEISARIVAWEEGGAILMSPAIVVTLNGKEVEGATVTMEPEEFLQPAIKACSGVTNEFGAVDLTGAHEEYPGIHYGLYRVKISKMENGKESIPAKYNTQTTLGYEAADDTLGEPTEYSSPETAGLGLMEIKLTKP